MISVIVPVFNVEQFLPICLDSIIGQTISNWECLLIDDGSTDNSGAICDCYSKKDNRFRTFHISNQGVSHARNVGLKNIKGDLVTFLDADDYYSDDTLSILSNIPAGIDFMVCGYRYVSRENSKVQRNVDFGKDMIVYENPINYVFDIFDHRKMFFFCYGKTYRSNIVQNNGIQFDEDMSLGEDRIFVLKYMEKIRNMKLICNCGMFVRQSAPQNLSSKKRSFDDSFFNIRNNYEYLTELASERGIVAIRKYADNFIASRVFEYVVCPYVWRSEERVKLKTFVDERVSDYFIKNRVSLFYIYDRRVRFFVLAIYCRVVHLFIESMFLFRLLKNRWLDGVR